MSHAEICQVCGGSGTYGSDKKPCHGCGGFGWVTVGLEYSTPSPSTGWCTCHLKGKTTAEMPCPTHG
ncbi:MAG: hypothetical protein FVQ80_06930 [Planctomycetes bacterium]|nr:hypothetical protein [Planctomycetota bacterium]